MAFLLTDIFSAPTASAGDINAGQDYGSSSLPGAPSAYNLLPNTGETLQPSGGSGGGGGSGSTSTGGGFSNFDPNTLGPPADVTSPSLPSTTSGGGTLAVYLAPKDSGIPKTSTPTTPTTTTTTATTTSATDDAINRLIDLASQQPSSGGGGGIVALPTGIASSGGTSGGGLSLGAVAIIVAVIAIGAYMWNKHNKKKAAPNA